MTPSADPAAHCNILTHVVFSDLSYPSLVFLRAEHVLHTMVVPRVGRTSVGVSGDVLQRTLGFHEAKS